MRSVLAYTSARLLLFAVAFGILYLLGARGLLAVGLAVLVSGLVSYILLSGQRDAMSSRISAPIDRVRGLGDRLEQGSSHEDESQLPGSAPAAPVGLREVSERADRAAQARETEEPARDETGQNTGAASARD